MGKGVKKHCSISNYLRREDPELYELIQDLCITRMLVPRRGGDGVTFLRPDKKLKDLILAKAMGDDPEEAVEMLQSLVLLTNLKTPSDFAAQGNDISTFLRRKLPFDKVEGNAVVLTNKAKIVLDTKFDHRKDRPDMSVYIISGHLVPTDTEKSESVKKLKKNEIKGGGDYTGDVKNLFTRILNSHCNEERMVNGNPALEVLCSLCDYLENARNVANAQPDVENQQNTEAETLSDEYTAVTSQLSWDTIASLAIILQPFRDTKRSYVSESTLQGWLKESNQPTGVFADVYYYKQAPVVQYKKHMEYARANAPALDKLDELQLNASHTISKPTVVGKINDIYEKIGDVINETSSARAKVLKDGSQLALAESELRIMSAILHNNTTSCALEKEVATSFYVNKYTLNKPFMINNKDVIKHSDIAFYYSNLSLILRSNSVVYWPRTPTSNLTIDNIADSDGQFCLDAHIKNIVSVLDYTGHDNTVARFAANVPSQ